MKQKRKEYDKQYRHHYYQKNKRISFILSNEEYRAFSVVVKGKQVNNYIKALALSGLAKQRYIPTDIQQELSDLNFLVRNIANNINQLSHSANIFYDIDRNLVFEQLAKLDKTINDYVRAKVDDS